MLKDLVFDHPEYILAGCGAWIVVSAWVLTIIHRMIMGDIDVLTGVIALFTVVGLGTMSIHAPQPFLQPLSFVLLYASGILLPIFRGIYLRREAKSVDVEGVEKAYEGFVLRPNNPSAQMRLARHLYNLGVRGHALVLAESAVQQLPRQYFPDEYRLLDQWRQHPPPQSDYDPIPCADCGTRNPAGMIHCSRCGARYLLDRVKGKAVPKTLARRLFAAWIVMLLSLVGIPYAATVGGLGAVAVIAVLLLASFGALFMAFRSGEPTA